MDDLRMSTKLADARRALMLPHPDGEAQSIADAFFECSKVIGDLLRSEDLGDQPEEWVRTLATLMDASTVADPSWRGTRVVKAESFAVDEKHQLSRAVDELAHWAARRFWEARHP